MAASDHKEFINEAVREGIEDGINKFMAHLEESLKLDVEMKKSGSDSPRQYLDHMIQEQLGGEEEDYDDDDDNDDDEDEDDDDDAISRRSRRVRR